MSAQECTAAQKIQDAWRKYQESKDDDDMHEVHEMGWSMFDGDELDASHYHQNLTDYEQGYQDGIEQGREDAVEHVRSLDQANFEENSTNQALFEQYNAGYDDARREGEEDFQLRLQVEINLAKKQAYDDGVIQGSSLADDVIRSLREEIDRLKRSNSRMREDIQFLTQPTRKL
tara:strand:+ start:255 stop:776 length:522 start_codon:yes stop_codon:yes gene_type:complete